MASLAVPYLYCHSGENIRLLLAVAETGTSSCKTSQCSTTLPSFILKISKLAKAIHCRMRSLLSSADMTCVIRWDSDYSL